MRINFVLSVLAITAIGHCQPVKVQSTARTSLGYSANVPVKAVGVHLLASGSYAVVSNGFVNDRFLPSISILNRNGVMTSNTFWDFPESFEALVTGISSNGKTIYVAGRLRDGTLVDRGYLWSFNTEAQLGFSMLLPLPNTSFWADTPTHISETENMIVVAGYRGETSINGYGNGRPFISLVEKSAMTSSYLMHSGFSNVRVTGLSVGGGRAGIIGTVNGENTIVYMDIDTEMSTILRSGGVSGKTSGGGAYDAAADVHVFGLGNPVSFGSISTAGLGFTAQFPNSAHEVAKMSPDGNIIFVDSGLRTTRYKYFGNVSWNYNPPQALFSQPPIGISINSLNEIITGNNGRSNQVYLTKLSLTGVRRWDIFHGPANLQYNPKGFDVHEKTGDILVLGTSRASNLDQVQVTILRQAPTAIADSFYTGRNKQFYRSLVQNDRAALGSVATIIQGPTNGTASISTIGNLTYNPNPNFTGVDTIKYQLSKPGLTSSVATCTLHVNP